MENANDHPFKVSIVKDAEFFANSHPYKVTIEGGGGNEGRVVDELPEEGEPGYIYLVLKEETEEGNIYDEYMWVLKQDETYGWEHIGATNEINLTYYDILGPNDDGVFSQRKITEFLHGEYGTNNEFGMTKHNISIGIGPHPASSLGRNSVSIGVGINGTGQNENTYVGISASPNNYHYDEQYGTGLGYFARGAYKGSTALGAYAGHGTTNLTGKGSVALGAFSTATRHGEVGVGVTDTEYGYNGTPYKLIGGVHDPIDAHDAATKGYVDDKIGQIETVLQTLTTGNGV